MQIERLEIKNYRFFRDAKLEALPRMAVVAGANARASPRCLTTPMCSTGVDGVSAVRLTAGRLHMQSVESQDDTRYGTGSPAAAALVGRFRRGRARCYADAPGPWPLRYANWVMLVRRTRGAHKCTARPSCASRGLSRVRLRTGGTGSGRTR